MKTKQLATINVVKRTNCADLVLKKTSTSEDIKKYFEIIIKLSGSGNKFPVNLDEVWSLVYGRKKDAIEALKRDFIQQVDYQVLRRNPQNPKGGRPKTDYYLSIPCLEFFIARKVRPVFEVYRAVFYERVEEEKNPDLAIDRGIRTYKRQGKSDEWISKRITGKARRNQFTACLAAHGVEHEGFRNCTNSIYTPSFGGSSNVVREKLGITKAQNPRDHMSELQLSAIQFAESLSQAAIEQESLRGNAQCEIACSRSARIVANAINQNSNNTGRP